MEGIGKLRVRVVCMIEEGQDGRNGEWERGKGREKERGKDELKSE